MSLGAATRRGRVGPALCAALMPHAAAPSNLQIRRVGSGSLLQSAQHGPLRDVDVPAAVCMVLSVADDANGARNVGDGVASEFLRIGPK